MFERTAGVGAEAAEERFRLAAERLAVRLRWLSLAVIPILGYLGPAPVATPWFELLIAAGCLYNLAIQVAAERTRHVFLLNVTTSIVDGGILVVACALTGGTVSPITAFPYVAMISVCMRLQPPWVVAVGAIYAFGFGILAWGDAVHMGSWLPIRLLYLLIVIAFVLPLVKEARARMDDVVTSQRAQRELLHRILHAGEEERRLIASEIHDRGGGALFTLLHGLRRIKDLGHQRTQDASQEIDRLIELTEATVQDLRILLEDLRPRLLDDLGFTQALRDLLTRERTVGGIEISFVAEATSEPDLERSLALYRVAQEAFTNIRRHSQAKSAAVGFTDAHGVWELTIEDDGVGFSGHSRGLGLRTMRERLEAFDGDFHLTSAPGGGTRIRARLPAPENPKP